MKVEIRWLAAVLRQQPAILAAATFVATWLALAWIAPWIAPHGALDTFGMVGFPQAPNREHLLGTDSDAKDLLSTLLLGARVTLGLGLASTALATGIGLLVGGLAGLLGGTFARVMQWCADLFLSLPALLVLLVVASQHGGTSNPSRPEVVLVLGGLCWMDLACLVRERTERLAASDFVLAARLQGLSTLAILRRHVLPHLTGLVGVAACLGMARMILLESTLSYLGFSAWGTGWGTLVHRAARLVMGGHATSSGWTALLLPLLLVVLTVVAFSVLGEGLRRAVDGRGAAR